MDDETTPKGWTYHGERLPVETCMTIEIESVVILNLGHGPIYKIDETVYYVMRGKYPE